jgi:hypothetical protein
LYGVTAYRNRYTIPKIKTLVKKNMPISTFLSGHRHTKNRQQDAKKTVEALG